MLSGLSWAVTWTLCTSEGLGTWQPRWVTSSTRLWTKGPRQLCIVPWMRQLAARQGFTIGEWAFFYNQFFCAANLCFEFYILPKKWGTIVCFSNNTQVYFNIFAAKNLFCHSIIVLFSFCSLQIKIFSYLLAITPPVVMFYNLYNLYWLFCT